jgi:hypothetical protein
MNSREYQDYYKKQGGGSLRGEEEVAAPAGKGLDP